jgi:peroxiredoxin
MFSRSVISVLALVVLVGVGAGAAEPEPAELQIGDAAPSFALPGVDGKTHRLEDFAAAKVLAVVFTCNHCPTAQAYEDRLIAIAREYKDKGVAVVAISPNDPEGLRLDELGYTEMNDTLEEMVVRAKDKQFNFPYLYDGDDQKVSLAYGPTATPHVFLFDQERKLRYKGRIDDNKHVEDVTEHNVRAALDALLAGSEVPDPITHAFGCSIKWAGKREQVVAALERWANEEVELGTIDLGGVQEILANKTDKVRFVNFWATWCVPCVQEFPEIVTMHRMYRKRPFEIITISVDDPASRDKALAFLEKQQASTTNYLYNSTDVYKLVEAVGKGWEGSIPFSLLIKPGGEVMYAHTGIIDPDTVKRMIVDYLGRVN